jgi:hypothetical protein
VTRKIGTPNDAANNGRASWIAADPNAHKKKVEKSGMLCRLRILLLVMRWRSGPPHSGRSADYASAEDPYRVRPTVVSARSASLAGLGPEPHYPELVLVSFRRGAPL